MSPNSWFLTLRKESVHLLSQTSPNSWFLILRNQLISNPKWVPLHDSWSWLPIHYFCSPYRRLWGPSPLVFLAQRRYRCQTGHDYVSVYSREEQIWTQINWLRHWSHNGAKFILFHRSVTSAIADKNIHAPLIKILHWRQSTSCGIFWQCTEMRFILCKPC